MRLFFAIKKQIIFEVIFMLIKRVFGKLLFNLSGGMIKYCTASFGTTGVEDMPESMKKLR
jgi:hypothetical protein